MPFEIVDCGFEIQERGVGALNYRGDIAERVVRMGLESAGEHRVPRSSESKRTRLATDHWSTFEAVRNNVSVRPFSKAKQGSNGVLSVDFPLLSILSINRKRYIFTLLRNSWLLMSASKDTTETVEESEITFDVPEDDIINEAAVLCQYR